MTAGGGCPMLAAMKRILSMLLGVVAVAGAAAAAAPLERWVYAPCNHLVPKEIDRLDALMRRAQPLGYTHFLIADSKFSRLDQMESRYFANIERIKKTGAELGLTLVPAIFPVGYSNDILWHDPNLAEGLPVRDALFVVKGGEARVMADPQVQLPGVSEKKKWRFVDDCWQADGDAMKATDVSGQNARFMISLKVSPFRQYHVSAAIKTQDFKGKPEIKAMAGNRALSYTDLHVKKTQDWTVHHITFNSLENTEVGVYIGAWGGGAGTWWVKDAMIEESAPVNLLRREGCPFTVTREGGPELKEGVDFEPYRDPRLGNQPYGGQYEVFHDVPPLKTKLPDGTRLRVSYFHTHVIYDEQVCGCVSEPAFMNLLKKQATDMQKTWGAPGYMMSHDEWRLFGRDESCRSRHLTPGQIIAENARQCVSFAHAAAPQATLYTWSDMFDPHHNAVKDYYLVDGDLAGGWEGLPKEVTIMNWNFGKRAESLKFFAERGHRQILAGYYDDGPEQIGRWLDAAKGVEGVAGVMYTTWRLNYADLEAFAKVVTDREKAGR